jgi:hypothetical protein
MKIYELEKKTRWYHEGQGPPSDERAREKRQSKEKRDSEQKMYCAVCGEEIKEEEEKGFIASGNAALYLCDEHKIVGEMAMGMVFAIHNFVTDGQIKRENGGKKDD